MKNIPSFNEFVFEATEDIGSNSFELSYPGTYIAKWTVTDAPSDENTEAKKFDLSIKVEHPDSTITGTTIKDSFTMAFSKYSTGVYSLGKDVEKFMGIPEEEVKRDVESGKESKDDAIIYGMVNIMNGGKDIYFWNNGTRMGGAAEKVGALTALVEQISHEAGVHLNRVLLTRHIARQDKVDTNNEDWVTYNYGAGEYVWPAVGDPTDKAPIIAIDEETFATIGGALVSIVIKPFMEMASKYVPDTPKF